MSLYLKSRRTSTVPHDHKITFITPAYATQLVPVYTMHGDKLDLNYSLPSMVTGYENGQFTELDHWTIVDPVSGKDTGKRFDFNIPITSDLTLKAHMRELILPTPDRDVKFRIIDSIDGKLVYEKTLTLKDNKIQDKDKAEINAVLAQKLAEKNHLLGKFIFRDWYLNADINKKFNINDTVESGISELNVFGLYNFEASSDIPDPNNPGQPKPLDPSLIKVTFLSDTTSVLSIQTSPKNSTFKGTFPTISKAGYHFKYWAYFKDNQVAGQFGLNDVLTENTTLYPIFEKDPNPSLPDTTVVATIVNKLLGTKEVRLVKKGELLDLDPQQYTTHLSPYLYEFSRFTNENGTTFNHLTERIFSNKTIYVEHTKVARDQVNYEIKHVFEGKEGEADRVETQTKQALVDSLVTVSPSDKLTGYEYSFELETTQSETKQVSSEFTTQFTLKYRRRRFDVNFETNFNNRFDGDVSPSSKQKVKYEGTAVEPTNPTNTKPGYKYTFVQWQLKSSMNGEYVKTQAYDFSKPVTGDVDLVAYFKEEKTTSTFQIKHVIEGVDDIQEETRVVTKTAKVGSTFTVTDEHRLPEFDEHFTIDGLNQTKEISANGTTVFILNYVRKLYDVFYAAHRGYLVDSPFINAVHVGDEPEPYKAKYQAKVKKPAYTPGLNQPGYSYRFVHWQDESKMNGTYQEIPGFDFENDRVNGNMYLLAYFVQTVKKVNYTVNHVFEGVDDIAEKIEPRLHQANTDTEVTVSRDQRLTEFDEHFTVDTQSQTQKIKGDGTTVFTLNYVRKSYTVTYEVNFNGIQFTDAMFGNEPQSQSIKYQGKITKPAVNPTLSRVGYSYTFVQWQEKTAMNGQYKPTTGFNFNDFRVEKDITLVAYFAETANAVNYTINHVIEGTDDGIAEQTITRTYTAIADSNHTVSRAQRLPEYEEHFTVVEQTQTKQIKPDGTTVFILEYKRKSYTVTYEVNYNGNHFANATEQNKPSSQTVKYQGKVNKPTEDPMLQAPGLQFSFTHWQDKAKMNGTYSNVGAFNFNSERIVKNTTITAYFSTIQVPVSYTIRHVFEGVDDIAQEVKTSTKYAFIGTNKTVDADYKLPGYEEGFTVVGPFETKKITGENQQVFTLNYNRREFTVTYEVNYNSNHFSEVEVGGQPSAQTVKYQGKVQKPASNPTLTKEGYNYTFVQWQEKTAMNGNYSQINGFNFANQRITRNTTLVAYFTENPKLVNYTINHVFQGVGDIAQRTDARVHQALADSNKTITYADRLTEFDEHFNVDNNYQMTEKINRHGTTVFTLVYRRKLYDVYYEVQYNDTQFGPELQIHTPVGKYLQVPYQGKAPRPHDPIVSKPGYTYTFVHWQLKEEMNGTYQKVSAYNFNQGVEKNITLVAYFEEKLNKVNYQVTYFLEKQGESSSLNNTYQEVTKTYTAPAFSQVHLQPYQDLDLTKYDADTVDGRNKLHAQLTHENNTVVLKKYYQLKEYQISFAANDPTFGNIPIVPDYQKVTRKNNSSKYHFSANQGYKFIGISLDGSENNLVNSFIMPANDVTITAIFKENKKAIIYNIRLENADGTFTTQTKTYYAKVGSVHNTTFENPDTNIYEKWEADKNSLVVSESQVQNLVLIKVTRKKFKVTFNVLNSDVTIQERTRRYGEQIGEIKHYSLRQIDILLFKLDGVKKSKLEVETHEVTSNLTVEIKILNDRKANHYPQTEVALSQSSIWKEQEYPSLELVLVFNGEVLRTSYTRKVVFDKNEEQYEVIAGKYYKYEPIEFVQIPGNTGYFTKKIIDAVPFSLYQPDKDVQFEGSIFMEQIKNIEYISWMRNLSAPLVSFSDKSTCLDNALKDPQLRPQLRKEPTDYARAIFRQYTGISKFWRGIDFTTLPHGYAQNDLSYLPIYEQSEMMSYWCSVIGKANQHVGFFKPCYITTDLDTKYSNPNIVRGLVLAKENM